MHRRGDIPQDLLDNSQIGCHQCGHDYSQTLFHRCCPRGTTSQGPDTTCHSAKKLSSTLPSQSQKEAVMVFVAFLHRERLSGGTVKNYLPVVRYSQISLGLGDPKIGDMTCLDYVLKRLTATPRRSRLPITPQILDQLREAWESQLHLCDASMLWAAATMRVGEAVAPSDGEYDPAYHLSYADIRTDVRKKPQYQQVHIRVSKTDPFRKGVSIFLGRAGGQLCPVPTWSVVEMRVVLSSSSVMAALLR